MYDEPRLYDAIYDPFVADIPFYRELALDARRAAVCELACGTGRVTVPLALAGVDITGVDLSSHMIAAARRRAAREYTAAGVDGRSPGAGRAPRFLVGDMRYPPVDPGFGLVVIPLHSLSHLLDRDDVLRCLRSVRRVLMPGGRLAFAVHNPDPATIGRDPDALYEVRMPDAGAETDAGHTPSPEPGFEYEPQLEPQPESQPQPEPECRVLESTRYDPVRKILHVRWWVQEESANSDTDYDTHSDTDSLVPFDFKLRLFPPRELDELLTTAGFTLEVRWGWYDRSPFTPESGTQVVVARRR